LSIVHVLARECGVHSLGGVAEIRQKIS
jgi:hypothetical protein